MMIHGKMKVGGVLTYWSTGEYSELTGLQDGLTELGLGVYAPKARTPGAALRDALEEVYPGRDHQVQPLQERDAYEVIRIKRGDVSNGNLYIQVLTAKLENDTIRLAPLDANATQIQSSYNRHLGKVRGPSVTETMVKILTHLGGTRLREKGGVYWITDVHLETWNQVAKVIESAASVANRPNNVYCIRHEMDADAMRAVRDAIITEISKAAAMLEDEVLAGDLGDKALKNREETARALRTKIHEYEEILGCGLTSLSEAVDKAEHAAMTAALVGSGAAVA